MPRCPSCNRFKAIDTTAEPEFDLTAELRAVEGGWVVGVRGTVTLTNTCEDCGEDLTTLALDVDADSDLLPAVYTGAQDGDELEAEEQDAERTDETTGSGKKAARLLGCTFTVAAYATTPSGTRMLLAQVPVQVEADAREFDER